MKKNTILLVDDDEALRVSIGSRLSKWGYEVITVEDGDVAIEKLKHTLFDLVITDLVMERVGGLDVLRAAKASDPQALVIVLTAHASLETAVEALCLKADDYITKPCAKEELELKVRRCMEIANNNRKIRQLEKFLPMCSICKKVCDSFIPDHFEGEWVSIETFLEKKVSSNIPYLKYCPECTDKVRREAEAFKNEKKA